MELIINIKKRVIAEILLQEMKSQYYQFNFSIEKDLNGYSNFYLNDYPGVFSFHIEDHPDLNDIERKIIYAHVLGFYRCLEKSYIAAETKKAVKPEYKAPAYDHFGNAMLETYIK